MTSQAEINAFTAQISKHIGRTACSVSDILSDATHKINNLAKDEALKPIFKQLKEYMRQENKPFLPVFDLLGGGLKGLMKDVDRIIKHR
jgi:hypothetical protein